MEKGFDAKLKRWRNNHTGCHDFQRMLETNEKMLVWCRKCSGYTRVHLRGNLFSHCQPFVEEGKKERGLKRIQKSEEGQVSGGKGLENWRNESSRRRNSEMLRSAIAQRRMCHLMDQRMTRHPPLENSEPPESSANGCPFCRRGAHGMSVGKPLPARVASPARPLL